MAICFRFFGALIRLIHGWTFVAGGKLRWHHVIITLHIIESRFWRQGHFKLEIGILLHRGGFATDLQALDDFSGVEHILEDTIVQIHYHSAGNIPLALFAGSIDGRGEWHRFSTAFLQHHTIRFDCVRFPWLWMPLNPEKRLRNVPLSLFLAPIVWLRSSLNPRDRKCTRTQLNGTFYLFCEIGFTTIRFRIFTNVASLVATGTIEILTKILQCNELSQQCEYKHTDNNCRRRQSVLFSQNIIIWRRFSRWRSFCW